MGRRRVRLFLAGAGAAIAAGLAFGLAWAAIPGSNGVISGCYGSASGNLRVIDAEAGESCQRQEVPLSWNQTGPQGPQGPQGLQGPAGSSRAVVEPIVGIFPLPGGQVQRLATVAVPAGNWTIFANLRLEDRGAGDSVSCELITVPGSEIDTFHGAGGAAPMTGWVSFTGGGGEVWLECTASYQTSAATIGVAGSAVIVSEVDTLVTPPAPPPGD